MQKLAMEQQHLAKADSRIADGEKRIAAQLLLVERLKAASRRTDVAEALLRRLQDTLEVWNAQRGEILREIRRVEDASPH